MMTPAQRKAFSEACAILNAAKLPDVNALLVALHTYAEWFGNCGSPAQQNAADTAGAILQQFVTFPDLTLSNGAVARHLPAANGSTDVVLRAGRTMTEPMWVEYVALRRAGVQEPIAG